MFLVRLRAEAKDLCLLQSVRTGPEASCSADIGTFSPGLERPGRETNRQLSPTADVPYRFMACTWINLALPDLEDTVTD